VHGVAWSVAGTPASSTNSPTGAAPQTNLPVSARRSSRAGRREPVTLVAASCDLVFGRLRRPNYKNVRCAPRVHGRCWHRGVTLPGHAKGHTVSIIFISETSDPIDKYDEVIALLEARGLGHPTGRLSHLAASTGDGYIVVDVWESQELLEQFAQALVPLILQTGGTTPHPQVHQIHNAVVRA
jgi:hypothetical protein